MRAWSFYLPCKRIPVGAARAAVLHGLVLRDLHLEVGETPGVALVVSAFSAQPRGRGGAVGGHGVVGEERAGRFGEVIGRGRGGGRDGGSEHVGVEGCGGAWPLEVKGARHVKLIAKGHLERSGASRVVVAMRGAYDGGVLGSEKPSRGEGVCRRTRVMVVFALCWTRNNRTLLSSSRRRPSTQQLNSPAAQAHRKLRRSLGSRFTHTSLARTEQLHRTTCRLDCPRPEECSLREKNLVCTARAVSSQVVVVPRVR